MMPRPSSCEDLGTKQTSFGSAEYTGRKRKTRRKRLLAGMNAVVPSARSEALIEPRSPRIGEVVGRPTISDARTLRRCFRYFLQQGQALLHRQESQVHGDSGCSGLNKWRRSSRAGRPD